MRSAALGHEVRRHRRRRNQGISKRFDALVRVISPRSRQFLQNNHGCNNNKNYSEVPTHSIFSVFPPRPEGRSINTLAAIILC